MEELPKDQTILNIKDHCTGSYVQDARRLYRQLMFMDTYNVLCAKQ